MNSEEKTARNVDSTLAISTVDPLESFDPETIELLTAAGTQDADPTVVGTENATEVSDVTLVASEQNEFQEICSAFESQWESGQEPSIADFLAEDMDNHFRLSLVQKLVLLDIEIRKRLSKDVPTEAYYSEYPHCRSAVEAAMSQRKSTVPKGYGSLAVPRAKPKRDRNSKIQHPDDKTSRYHPTKFVAQGGLGAVFKARDQELNRVVALKEVLLEHAHSPRVQEKFVFEAEVTGGLEHPGIVPVYGLGRYEDDHPYYAMRFVEGKTFRKTIETFFKAQTNVTSDLYFSREFRGLLRRLIDACNAIHYAHQQGVIHRDIKPENIMVGEYGETLVVDWGLAKRLEVDRDEDGHTVIKPARPGSYSGGQGSVVGTPMFMSPEQAQGKHEQTDGRTDVYSLGATLFNVVTGAYPIAGKTTRDVVENVRAGNILSARTRVSAVPRPLESICRRAMATNPEDRYATPVELADEIERWLNDDAVIAHAEHESLPERAGRWLRRYRSWTISIASALLVITFVALLSVVLINQAKQKEALAKDQAQGFKQDAVQRYRDSRAAIDTWLVQSSDALEFFPGTQAVRQQLLQTAINDYERLAKMESDDAVLELERGRAFVRMGDLWRMQEKYNEAIENYELAQALFATPVEDVKLAPMYRYEHAYTHARIAKTLGEQDNIQEANKLFERAIDELQAVQDPAVETETTRLLAATQLDFGSLLSRAGDDTESIAHLQLAVELYQRVAETDRELSDLGTSKTQTLLGRIYYKRGEYDRSLDLLEEAEITMVPLVEAEPDHPEYLDTLASVRSAQAEIFRVRGLESPLFAVLRNSVDSYRALNQALPNDPRYIESLGMSMTNLGVALHEAGQNPEALKILTEAEPWLRTLNSGDGLIQRFRVNLATNLDALGQVQTEWSDEPNEAAESLAEAEEILFQLASAATPPEHFERLAIVVSHFARLLDRAGNSEASGAKYGEAIQLLERCVQERGDSPILSNALAHVHYRFALSLSDREEPDAQQQFQLARGVWERIKPAAATHLHDLAWMLATCPDEMNRDLEAAGSILTDVLNRSPDNAKFRASYALVMALTGQPEKAIESLNRAKASRGSWIDRDYFVLALAQHLLGESEPAKQSFEAGTEWMETNRPYNDDARRLRAFVEERLSNQAN